MELSGSALSRDRADVTAYAAETSAPPFAGSRPASQLPSDDSGSYLAAEADLPAFGNRESRDFAVCGRRSKTAVDMFPGASH